MISPVPITTHSSQTLTPEQVTEKLKNVPVFVITNASGAPLTASGPKQKPTMGAFLRKQDATAFLDETKKKNPALGETLQIIVLSLSDVMKQAEQLRDTLGLAFVPDQAEVTNAKAILKAANKDDKDFVGVPLFALRVQDKGYLTVEREGVSSIPVFFVKSEAQLFMDRAKKEQPTLMVSLEVASLESVINLFKTSKVADVAKLSLIIGKEALAALPPTTQKTTDKP